MSVILMANRLPFGFQIVLGFSSEHDLNGEPVHDFLAHDPQKGDRLLDKAMRKQGVRA
jgi:hypothetical protein